MNTVTNHVGQTYEIGGRVRHNLGWVGTITSIRRTTNNLIVVHVQPDDELDPRIGGWDLDPSVWTSHGHRNFIEARDHGLTMGNYEPIQG